MIILCKTCKMFFLGVSLNAIYICIVKKIQVKHFKFKKSMETQTIYNLIILDASASMQTIYPQALRSK